MATTKKQRSTRVTKKRILEFCKDLDQLEPGDIDRALLAKLDNSINRLDRGAIRQPHVPSWRG